MQLNSLLRSGLLVTSMGVAGCVTTTGSPIPAGDKQGMKGAISSLIVLQQPFSMIEFSAPEQINLVFGASGMPIGAAVTRPIDREQSISLGAATMERLRLRPPAEGVAEGVAQEVARVLGLAYVSAGNSDYVVEIDGDHYGITTLPKYTLLADFHFRLRRSSDNRVISSGTCRYLTPDNQRKGSNAEWLANDGELLRSEFRAASDYCTKRIVGMMGGAP